MVATNGSYLVNQTEMQEERYVLFYLFLFLSLSLLSDKFWRPRRKLHINKKIES